MKRTKLKRLGRMYRSYKELFRRSRDFRKFVNRYKLKPKRKTKLSHPLRKDKLVKTNDIFSVVADYFLEYNSGKYLCFVDSRGVKGALIRGRREASCVYARLSLIGNYFYVVREDVEADDGLYHTSRFTQVLKVHKRDWVDVIYELPKVLPELGWFIESKGEKYDFSKQAEEFLANINRFNRKNNASKKTKW